jgi:hypothetical protein
MRNWSPGTWTNGKENKQKYYLEDQERDQHNYDQRVSQFAPEP